MSLIVHRHSEIPDRLARSIEGADLHYSSVTELLHFIWLDCEELAMGIFGDPEMGCYEWFVWDGSELTHSDAAFGGPDVAFWALLERRRK